MFLIGIVFGICVAGLSYLVWTDYQLAKEDEKWDKTLRDMEQYYIEEYYDNGKENK
jgi:hypothetical protein